MFQHYGFCRSVVLKQYLTEVPKLDNLAILCKRLTCLNSTNFRVKYSFNHFANHLKVKVKKSVSSFSCTSTNDVYDLQK